MWSVPSQGPDFGQVNTLFAIMGSHSLLEDKICEPKFSTEEGRRYFIVRFENCRLLAHGRGLVTREQKFHGKETRNVFPFVLTAVLTTDSSNSAVTASNSSSLDYNSLYGRTSFPPRGQHGGTSNLTILANMVHPLDLTSYKNLEDIPGT